jgi:hypothetical protein
VRRRRKREANSGKKLLDAGIDRSPALEDRPEPSAEKLLQLVQDFIGVGL